MNRETLSRRLRNKIAKSASIEAAVGMFLKRQEARVRGDLRAVIGELYNYIWEHYGDIPKAQILESVATTLDGFGVKADLAGLDGIYSNTAKAVIADAGLGKFVFDKVDNQTLNAIRKNFFWLGDMASEKTRDRLYEIVESAFRGDVARDELADILKNEFGTALAQETRYFKDVADHIVSQGQNLARVRQGQKYGVEYYKIMAVMDNRTSKICRFMNGKVIPAKHLERQTDAIQAAKNINQKKDASPWLGEKWAEKQTEKRNPTKIPKNFGLPPYHFRCRTILQPVFLNDAKLKQLNDAKRVMRTK